MNAVKTTYEVDGMQEPCFEITTDDRSILVRIATCYHYIGANTLYVTEYIDGDFNGSEEIRGDFESLTLGEAKRIAKQQCIYLY